MKIPNALLTLILILTISNSYGQGCVINNYNGFNRVFNNPTSAGARTFFPGNGNNFVRWENQCGIHTYVETRSVANGTCSITVNNVTTAGVYYPVVSTPFTMTCQVPIDDYVPFLILLSLPMAYFGLRRQFNFQMK